MGKFRLLVRELSQRHVYRVAAAYAVVGWLLIQVVAVTFPLLLLPEWLTRTVVVLILLGFPIALVLAWAFDVPGGANLAKQDSLARHPNRSRRIGMALAMTGVLIALAGWGAWWYFDRNVGDVLRARKRSAVAVMAAASPVKSIAVLPLVNLGGNADDNYLGEGISEEVLNALSKLHGLKVIGRTSSFRFQGNNVNAATIGRELGVRNLLSGTVQRAGEELRVNVELDDASTGVQLWSQQYDRRMQDLFALEDDISAAIAKALEVKLGAAPGQPLVFEGTASSRAHDLYLQGIGLYWRTDEASLDRAMVLFNQAIAEDPNYAAAWAAVAQTYAYLADVYRAPLDVLPAMRGAARKAVSLNPDLARGHLQLGYVDMSYDWDFPAARRELERAVALNPGLAEAHAVLGLYRLRIDRDPARARAELRSAEKLDPLNAWFPRWEMLAALAQGDHNGAMQLAQRVRAIDPDFAYNGDAVAYVDSALGRWRDCIDRYTIAHVKPSASSPQLAICQAHGGNSTRARATLAQLESAARTGYVDQTYVAAIDAALGDKDRAFAALEQAYRDHSVHMISLWANAWYQPLRDDPRFKTLTDRIAAGKPPD